MNDLYIRSSSFFRPKKMNLCFLVFLFLFPFSIFLGTASPAFSDHRTVTQWRPYLEWSAVNPTWSGNPFDLSASVTFIHEDSGTHITTSLFYAGNNTWRWRFTGTKPGNWSYSTTSSDDDLDGLSGTISVTPQLTDGFYIRMQGDKWGWSGSERPVIPNYVMLSSDPSSWDSDAEIDNLIDEFIHGHGFSGFHVPSIGAYWFDKGANGNRFSANTSLNSASTAPDPETFAALEKLIAKTHNAGGGVHIWLWGDSARTQNLTVPIMSATGGANGVVDNRLQRYIAARLGPLPGWSAGYGFDLFEWTDEEMLTTWSNYLNNHFGWDHFLGARGRKNVIENSQISENLDYTAYEQHAYLFDFDDWVSTHQDRPSKPSFTEDRFRIRDQGREKDFQQDGSDTRTLLWDLAMAGGIAAIWGNLVDSPDGEVSSPYPNKQQIMTYSTFWKKYFQKDIFTNTNLSSDTDTRILVNHNRSSWIAYRRNTSTIQLDLSGAPDALRAIAVNTQGIYNELDLGTMENRSLTITLPSHSDWALSLSTTTAPPPPPGDRRLCVPLRGENNNGVIICL